MVVVVVVLLTLVQARTHSKEDRDVYLRNRGQVG